MEYYYAQNNEQVGPLTFEAFQQHVTDGVIQPNMLVWHTGLPDWIPLSQLELAGLERPAPSEPIPTETETVAVSGEKRMCEECRRAFPTSIMLQIGKEWVCLTCKPIFIQRLLQLAPRDGMQYATIGSRFVAKLVDGLIQYALYVLITLAFGAFSSEQTSVFGAIIYMLGSFLIFVGYGTFFVGRFGATPGKMVRSIKIVRSDGDRVSYMRAFGRVLAEVLSGALLYLGYLIAFFDEERRALHDRICDTRVIQQ